MVGDVEGVDIIEVVGFVCVCLWVGWFGGVCVVLWVV